jgi:peptidylprolyl isomerase
LFVMRTGEFTPMSDQLATRDRTIVKGPRHQAVKAQRENRPAIVGAFVGVAVVGVLIAILVGSRDSGSRPPQAAAPVPASAAPATTAGATGPLAVKPVVTAGKGTLTKLRLTTLVAGTGPVVLKGQSVTVNYVLVKYSDGKQIEASWDNGGPIPLVVGVGRLIKGWDQALPGLKVGSRVQLDVPQELAYGPSKGDLRFVIDILGAQNAQ